LDKFGSVEAVLTASTEELVSIKGIGANTVDTIHWAVREPETEYNDFGEASDPIL
jgi:ERCC4-type nuclease